MAQIGWHEDYIEINGHRIYVSSDLRAPLLVDECGAVAEPLVNEGDTDISAEALARLTTLKQFADMQKLPGLVGAVGLPDIHAGYAFPVGSVAAIDLARDDAVVSPDGIGFDINCGVRCLVSNLYLSDIAGMLDEIADRLVQRIPSGLVDSDTSLPGGVRALNAILDSGLDGVPSDFLPLDADDVSNTESCGHLPGDSKLVHQRAKARGLAQLGTLGSGNHYLEVQVVDEIFDEAKAEALGLKPGQILISVHTGSRGLGHVTCSKFVEELERARADAAKYKDMRRTEVSQAHANIGTEAAGGVSSVPYHSSLGQRYVSLMNSASNYAWANRALIGHRAKEVLGGAVAHAQFKLLYDVCHNIAKIEEYEDGGNTRSLLVHRKGAARALPPHHKELPACYRETGQPIPVGGSMGTCSYVLVGAEGSRKTFYSTCHGAGRLLSRSTARSAFTYEEVLRDLEAKGIVVRAGSKGGLVEEACGCYKDIESVVDHSVKVGVVQRVARVRPVIVIKG
ncbi:tRNA-splicing ligase RtcB (3'-phosphate/5'-hydroxy nucleic acid ligase) [Pancytospora philotis]|nr:tRNA-splicing ligase RtcB (3'-phosphate/5'-hydroxy nucleic acid ligase) [Pancytospora philotis]